EQRAPGDREGLRVHRQLGLFLLRLHNLLWANDRDAVDAVAPEVSRKELRAALRVLADDRVIDALQWRRARLEVPVRVALKREADAGLPFRHAPRAGAAHGDLRVETPVGLRRQHPHVALKGEAGGEV